MIDVLKLRVGDKVHYQPEHYGETRWENGLIKEIPDSATAKPRCFATHNCIRVVYNCAGNWGNFKDYTSALTNLRDLKLGWKDE